MAELNLPESVTPAAALRVMRLIWAALLAMQFLVAGVVIALVQSSPPTAVDPWLRQVLFMIAVGTLVVLAPLGMFVRTQTYKAHWRGPVVTPNGYVKANILLLAMLEGVAIAAVVFMVVGGFHVGLIGVAAVAMLLQLASFPTGKPMLPHEPALPEPEKL